MNHGRITSNPNVLQCNGNIPVQLQPKMLKFKVMLAMLWDSQGVLLAHFQKPGGNVNSALYCEVLWKLWDAIRRKRQGELARGVLLHHDNARPHKA
jgi:hypothetical protein